MKTPVKELSAKFGLREKDIKILFKFGAIQIPPSQEDLIFLTKLSKIWRKSKVLAVQLSGKRKAEIQRIINMARGKDEIDEFIESFITEQKRQGHRVNTIALAEDVMEKFGMKQSDFVLLRVLNRIKRARQRIEKQSQRQRENEQKNIEQKNQNQIKQEEMDKLAKIFEEDEEDWEEWRV
jgi:hypothetical protein